MITIQFLKRIGSMQGICILLIFIGKRYDNIALNAFINHAIYLYYTLAVYFKENYTKFLIMVSRFLKKENNPLYSALLSVI